MCAGVTKIDRVPSPRALGLREMAVVVVVVVLVVCSLLLAFGRAKVRAKHAW